MLALAAAAFVLGLVRFFGGIDARDSLYLAFDFTEERNIPTALTTLLLLAAAGLALWSALLARRQRSSSTPYWVFLVLVLTYLAVDEALEIHERTLQGLGELWLQGSLSQRFAWIFPAAVLVLLVVAALWRLVFGLPARVRWAFIGAAGLYVVGAIVVETIGDVAFYYTESLALTGTITLSAETLEMLGPVLLIYGLLTLIASWQFQTEGG